VLELRAADPKQRRMLEQYTARLSLPPGARVLEIGCGTGAISRFLVGLPGIGEVVGVDPCPHFVQRGRELADDPRLQLHVGDGRGLELPDASFDAVVFHTTLCHVPDSDRALAEAYRLLVPGGQLVVFDGDYASTTVATRRSDPLQACADAAIEALVHDPWLVRGLTARLLAMGFERPELDGYAYTTTDAEYMAVTAERGADALARAGTVAPETAAALKAEVRSRIAAGAFFGHIAYASAVAWRP
jgi:SAM-dependent methyltransferase